MTKKITLHRHPFAGDEAPQFYCADSIGEWLLDHYGAKPAVRVQVFAGAASAETEITGDLQALLRNDADEYTVLESPGVEAAGFIISMLISVAVNAWNKPSDNGNPNRDQQSPNNQLSNRENRIRTMERVEDIYGTVRSIPSLMMPTYFKYISHQKVEYGYYCVGRGYHDITDIRDGDTLISSITGASAAVYAPFTSPNSGSPQTLVGDPIIDPILTVSRSSSVDGIVLKPTNQLQLTNGYECYFAGPGGGVPNFEIPASSNDTIVQPESARKPNFAAVCEPGQVLTIGVPDSVEARTVTSGAVSVSGSTYYVTQANFFTGVVPGTEANIGGFAEAANNGLKTVVSVAEGSMTVAEALTSESGGTGQVFAMSVNRGGPRTITFVGNGYVELAGPNRWPAYTTPVGVEVPDGVELLECDLSVANGLSDWTDWYTLPATDRTEVWTNVAASNGVYKDDGAQSSTSVEYQVQIEQLTDLLVPTGVVETVSGSLTGSTRNERAETLERVTAWEGPCRVRARRTTPFDYDFGGLVVDEIQWVDLYSVSPVSKAHFGNKTTIHTITMANSRATTLRRRELNCLAARKLPLYNGTSFSGAFNDDGQLVSGTISATSRIVDIIPAIAVDPHIGNLNLADNVDMAQLWATQQALVLWNERCGEFNYTFDTDAMSFEETISIVANAAFCIAYRQNGKIRLALDRPQSTSVALFTHRNKRPNAESITRTFANDSEYDGIELAYQDPDTEAQETIRLPLDGSFTKLKKVEVQGIRNYEQAWLRASREYNRLRSQRLSIETETTTDARALLPNSRVDIVDNTRFKAFDGEVVAQSGLELTLSRDVEFLPATAHSIVLMKRDGSLQSIACTAGSAANKVILAGAPAELIVTQPTAEDGIRTIFSFAADSARAAQAWLVQEIGLTEGQYIRIRAVNYSADYYAADSEAIPDKEGVIF